MILHPISKEDLANALRAANRPGNPIEAVDLSGFNRILAHTPEDMTAKVECGITLAVLQRALAGRGQWLPIDPPAPERLSIAALLGGDASGPRRFGFGTIRDHLIGLQVALADGRLINSGGNVVKNVAGFDLLKLFIGARGTLGLPVEATFKLRPLPEREQFVRARAATLDEAEALTARVLDSELAPVVLDWHREPDEGSRTTRACHVVVGFAGTREEVEWQCTHAASLGLSETTDLDYERAYWAQPGGEVHQTSVLPSRLAETVKQLDPDRFVARAGNGVIYSNRRPASPPEPAPRALTDRVQSAFDPHRILSGLRA